MKMTYRSHEEHSSTKAIHEHSCSHRPDQVPDLQARRDESLIINGGDTDRVEDDRQIVRDHTVSRPLRESSQANADEQAMAVARGGPQISPSGILLGFLLGLDGLLNLCHFEFDQRAFDVTPGVKVGQVPACLVDTVD